MNQVILVGRMTRDAQIKYIGDKKTPIASFNLAVGRDYKVDGKEVTDFIPIEVVGKPAEYVSKYLGKGRLIGLKGNIRIDEWLKDDEKRKFTKVRANLVKSLEPKKKDGDENYQFEPAFEPAGFDDELPF